MTRTTFATLALGSLSASLVRAAQEHAHGGGRSADLLAFLLAL